ncbi:hypothetical protein lerEdw1_020701, partial [Lerista edwardsae]
MVKLAKSEDEPMEITPAKGKKAVLPKATPAKVAKEESEDEDDDEEEEEEEDNDDDDKDELAWAAAQLLCKTMQEMPGKCKKEMAKQKGTLDAKKKKTEVESPLGFVDFSSPEDAKATKEVMEDGEIDGNEVTLDFAKSKGGAPVAVVASVLEEEVIEGDLVVEDLEAAVVVVITRKDQIWLCLTEGG